MIIMIDDDDDDDADDDDYGDDDDDNDDDDDDDDDDDAYDGSLSLHVMLIVVNWPWVIVRIWATCILSLSSNIRLSAEDETEV